MIVRERIGIAFMTLLRVGLGLFFLVVGGMKTMQLDQLTEDIVRFDIAPAATEWYLACIGIAMELAVGLMLVVKRLYLAATLTGCAITACFVVIFVQAWIRGLELSCNCLGVAREATNYPFEVGWRVVLFLAMLLLWHQARKSHGTWFKPVRLDFSDVG